ncbi:MAG: ABC transporter permease [Anaerolineae bacterium]|nr:ABC transporter permease [Anaerolineae bacterium]
MTDQLAPPVPPAPARYHIRVKPASRWADLPIRELWQFRDLLVVLTLRDIKLRYKQTVIGILWVVLQPLIAALIFAFVFGRVANLQSGDVPYLAFVFAALLPWNAFSGALQRAGGSLVASAQLISKVYFPRLIIPMAAALGVLVDFAVSLVVMLVILLLSGYGLTLNLLAIPFLLLITLINAVAIGTLISALSVFYRDFTYALPFLIQVWLYASPVVYAADIITGPLRPLYLINPMVGIIAGFRWAFFGGAVFPAGEVVLSAVFGAVALAVSLIVFQRVEQSFADVV